jgi:hypothetical protein
MDLLNRILCFLRGLVKPLPPTRFCAACGKEIGEAGFVFEGNPWCSYFCIPAVSRAKAAGVRP